jgi:hypothetical protein
MGIRRADGYQRMEETTIMKQKRIDLREFILEEGCYGSNSSGPHEMRGV